MAETKGVLLVTGGSRGIGAAIVRAAALRGYAVCFSYRADVAAASALKASLVEQGAAIHIVAGDVADTGFATALFDEATQALGPVTALVNNAGMTGVIGAFADLPLDVLRRTIDVNLLGSILMAQEAVRRWQTAGVAGRMVNISSVAATLGSPGEYVHYAATKAAIDALTIGLGKELAPTGIRVNAVAPGITYTDIHAAGGEPDRPERVKARIPLGRAAQADEIASAVLWLLSDEASYMTGSILRVGGGV